MCLVVHYGIFQEFGFSDPYVLMRLVHIYATSFYGSQLWDFSSMEAEKLFTSWNILVRTVPNTTHRYLIESQYISKLSFSRDISLLFIVTLRKSLSCQRSNRRQWFYDLSNLAVVSQCTDCDNVLGMSPSEVVNGMQYAPIPPDQEWRVAFLHELLEIRKNELELDWSDDVGLSLDQLNDLIAIVATS